MAKAVCSACLVAAALMFCAGEVRAAPSCKLVASGAGIVERVIDGDTVILRGGAQVRLVGTQAPKLPLKRKGFARWPLADEAKAKLEALVLGRSVQLKYGGRRKDRHGRALAHLFLAGEAGPVWVQREMIQAGMARVYSFADNRACIDALLADERRARNERRGIWAEGFYAVLRAGRSGALVKKAGSFQIISGRAVAAARKGRRIFINFGRDWRRDFTIVIPAKSWKLFKKKQFTLEGFTGRGLEVRGWIGLRNGPVIEVDHPEQIEFAG